MAFRTPQRDTSLRGTDPERRIKEQQPIDLDHEAYKKHQRRADEAYAEFKRLRGSKALRDLDDKKLDACLRALLEAENCTIKEIDARNRWNDDYKEGQGSGTLQKRTGHKGVNEHVGHRENFIRNNLVPRINECRALLLLPPRAPTPIDFAARQRESNLLRNSRAQVIDDRSHVMGATYADHETVDAASQSSQPSYASESDSQVGSSDHFSQLSHMIRPGSQVSSYQSQPSPVASHGSQTGEYGLYDSQEHDQHSRIGSYHEATVGLFQTDPTHSARSENHIERGGREREVARDPTPKIETVSAGWSHEYGPEGTEGALNRFRLRHAGDP